MTEEASAEGGMGAGAERGSGGRTRKKLGALLSAGQRRGAKQDKDLKDLRAKVKRLERGRSEGSAALEGRLEMVERRLAALEGAAAEAETRRSDHVAMTRRLAAIENWLRGERDEPGAR